jgi:hypothetical protein
MDEKVSKCEMCSDREDIQEIEAGDWGAFKKIESEDFSRGIEGRRRIRLSAIDFISQ